MRNWQPLTLMMALSFAGIQSAHAFTYVCSNGFIVLECNDGTQLTCHAEVQGDVQQVDCQESYSDAHTDYCAGHGGIDLPPEF